MIREYLTLEMEDVGGREWIGVFGGGGNADRVECRCPCLTCSIKLVQVGISEVVYSQGYSMDDRVSKEPRGDVGVYAERLSV